MRFEVSLEELGVTSAEAKATYEKIKKWVAENYNQTGSGKGKVPQCPSEKEKTIEEVLKHFQMI
ncbi:MAG: hypothetical protein E7307_07525 [Butyrivibrio sp.]|nr:hypothetical protein [Butyrivibrio sp.]